MEEQVFIEDLRTNSLTLKDSLGKLLIQTNFHVSEEDFVVIKVNLCDFRPAWEGCVTDVELIEELIYKIREIANPRIAIVESNHAISNMEELYERHSFKEMADRLGIELINLSTDEKVQLKVDGYYFNNKRFAKTITEMTKFVSVAVLKTHTQERITCILKNQFGFLSEKLKSKYHIFLSEVFVDLNNLFPPDLCIVDGRFAMEGMGPSDGSLRKEDIIIIGENAFAVDIACAKVMGFKPKKVPALKFAINKKLINPNHVKIITTRKKFEKFKFIPFYSYYTRRIGNFIARIGTKIHQMSMSVQEFLRLTSLGFLVLKRGYYVSDRTIFRNDGFRFAIGMKRKFFFLFGKKILLIIILSFLTILTIRLIFYAVLRS